MNYRLIFRQFSLLMFVLSGALAVVAVYSGLLIIQGVETEVAPLKALLVTAAIGATGGGVIFWVTRGAKQVFGRREAMLLVATSWMVGAGLAGLPYLIWAHLVFPGEGIHIFKNVADCYFEAMSGLTTTGATVLGDPELGKIETLPNSILLWRAVTHWLGGLGIVVLFVAVLPSLGVGGKHLFRVESSGPSPEGVRPHIRETARVLWLIYLGLTVAGIVCLRIAGMNWFDSICHTFSMLATGGLSTRDSSIGGDGVAVKLVIIAFMFCAGVSFGLYYQLCRGRIKNIFRDVELRVYIIVNACVAVVCILVLLLQGQPLDMTDGSHAPPTVGDVAMESVFTAVSTHTGTGFGTADHNEWPFICKALLIVLMFIGPCAGSTGGGIKVIRVWITFKVMLAELERAFRPNVIRPLKIGNEPIDTDMRLGVIAYVVGIFILFIAGAILLTLFETGNTHGKGDFTTTATASIATLCNVGPGFGGVGATENYGWFSAPSKIVMSILMAMGRLEVFAIILLFSPRFWMPNR